MTRAKSTSSSSGGSTTEEKYQHLGYHQKRTAPTGGTRKIVKALCTRILLLVVIPAIVVIAAFCWLRATGLNARGNPGAMESRLASALQRWAIPRGFRELNNPMQATPELLVEARRHFADHCASCHGNDGSGTTEMGQKLYPRVPDMRLAQTQNLSDGEIYYIIENGVRFTGMPAWGTGGTTDHDTWHLVLFIRHLPKMTDEDIQDMKEHNPRGPAEMKEEEMENEFLNEPSAAGGRAKSHSHERRN
jgi:mono/diheme cytochrome c family protein